MELAVERNPTHPDFTGLGEMMAGPVTDSGGATVSTFREWISGRQKDRANVLRQARMEREEVAANKKRAGGKGGDPPGKKGKKGGGNEVLAAGQ